ncbi:ABC transporter substrate-binding protein [Eubacteriaceae bacterium ES2]|nr:ABC transporter substrate-binding protein [Eubacteriaceae bacterium ES2]
MKKSVIFLLLLLLATTGLDLMIPDSTAQTNTEVIKIGALLPMSGIWQDSGTAAETALNAALPYVNDFLSDYGLSIELVVKDTQSDPDLALSGLEALKEQGITTVIGPMTSDEAFGVIDYANENGLLLISPSATSSDLSLPDNFYRLVASDKTQVDALSRVMSGQTTSLITVYVDDSYGQGYYDLVNQIAPTYGITPTAYVALDASYISAAADELTNLNKDIDTANSAILLVAPAETAGQLIQKVADNSSLASMKWYGSADIIGNETLVADTQVASFMESTQMEGMTIGTEGISLDALPYIASLLDGATAQSPYAITTWDALWLLADTYANAGDKDLAQTLVSQAGTFRNSFGTFDTLDANGDTLGAKFMHYQAVKKGDNLSWQCLGHYVSLGAGVPIVQAINEQIASDGKTVEIGALLPLTGNHSENGEEIESILNYGIEQFNAYAESQGSTLQLSLLVTDTESNPEIAAAAAQELVDQGITSIIGPINSSELAAVKPVADVSGAVVISPLSSVMSLAQKDQIYRLVLNDSVEAKALLSLFSQEGIESLIVLHADDSYGDEMTDLISSSYLGTVNDVSYDPDSTESIDNALVQAETMITDPEKTAVLTVSYNEIANIFGQIDAASPLLHIKWFGTDSSAQIKELESDSDAAAKAAAVAYTTIDFSPYGEKFDPLYCVINTELGTESPLKESLVSSFDGIWLLGCAYLTQGSSADSATINSYLVNAGFHGLGGVLKLDSNGDRAIGYYKLYQLANSDSGYIWENTGLYSQDLLKPGLLEMK